jgi:hypothetical protein
MGKAIRDYRGKAFRFGIIVEYAPERERRWFAESYALAVFCPDRGVWVFKYLYLLLEPRLLPLFMIQGHFGASPILPFQGIAKIFTDLTEPFPVACDQPCETAIECYPRDLGRSSDRPYRPR